MAMDSTTTFATSSDERPASAPAKGGSKRKETAGRALSEAAAADSEMTRDDVIVKRKAVGGESDLWDGEEDDPYVVMSAVWGGGMLGVAYYLVDTGHLYVMPDAAESEDFGLLHRILLQVQPRVILVSARVSDQMEKVLTDYIHSPISGGSEKETVANIEILPSGDFRAETCRQRLLTVARLPGVNPEGSAEEKLLQVSSLLPLDSVNMVRSVGALLKYADKKRLGVELEEEGVHVPIIAVKHFSLDNLLVMDESSYSALQIFQKEYHPSVYKLGKAGAKEGLSVFGIMNRARSSLGVKLLKLWFLRPLADIGVLCQRQEAVSFLMSPSHEETTATLHDCIKHVKNIPRILSRMNAAQASMTDWQSLYKCAYNGIYIGDICSSQPKTIYVFRRIAEEFSDDLHRIASLITKVVDFEESSVQQRFCVNPHVDEELDKLKELYNGLPDLLTRVAHEELEKLPQITECNITYLPQLGYLLVVDKAEVGQWMTEMGLSLVFETDNLAHFKSERMRELDTTLGDTLCEIQDHETAIMHRLQEVVLEHASSLLTVVELVAELDCLICLALFAKEHNCVRPELTEENVILIKGGRHPLQEMVVSTFVPNDTILDLKHGRMKILTGPNSSGKSIYLKQVGLIVFLAHIGSFVPAEAAKIGMMDHIFTRIQTRESVSVGLSAFMIDLNQVAAALNGATERSLVILDEFGKGTGTVDGISLLVASLQYWLEKDSECPNIVVSTHFHSIIQQKLLPNSHLIEYLTMETIQDGNELVFLYQLIPGHSDTSHACHIATLAGLPKEVVERGAQVTDLILQHEPIPPLNTPSMELRMKTCEKIVSRFLELDLENDDLEAFLKDFVYPTGKDIL